MVEILAILGLSLHIGTESAVFLDEGVLKFNFSCKLLLPELFLAGLALA